MSILIRGMDMPFSCTDCNFCSGMIMPDGIYACECPTTLAERNITRAVEEEERPDWCPLVEVSEPSYTDEWCHDCSEYDNEHHCCHRWAHVIRKTVEELQLVHCKDCVCYDSGNKMCLDMIGFGRRWEEMDYCCYGRRAE